MTDTQQHAYTPKRFEAGHEFEIQGMQDGRISFGLPDGHSYVPLTLYEARKLILALHCAVEDVRANGPQAEGNWE